MTHVKIHPYRTRGLGEVKCLFSLTIRTQHTGSQHSASAFADYLTLFILMDFPMHVERINMEFPISYFKGSVTVRNLFLSLQPDEMPHYVTFHLGLHSLPKYLFTARYPVCSEKGIKGVSDRGKGTHKKR